MSAAPEQPESRWPHRLAVLLVVATFPLIWVGGLVTTTQAGMAVPDWPGTYGYNLFMYPWQTWLGGPWDLFIEHGHRLLGALVGLLTIALLAAVWLCDERRWLRWVACGALMAVIGQGVLGGMRVLSDDRMLAKLHGCTGPAFFALCVALAVFTSPLWHNAAPRVENADAGRLQRLAGLTTLMAYVQLVLGAQVRHIAVDASPGAFRSAVFFHLLMAVVLLVHVALLSVHVWRRHTATAKLRVPASWLAGLMLFQLALGAITWIVKYAPPAWLADAYWAASYTIAARSFTQSVTITAHVAAGSLILVTALLIFLRSVRLFKAPAHTRSLELGTRLMEVAV